MQTFGKGFFGPLVFVIIQFRQVFAAFEGHFEFLKIFDMDAQITVALLDTGVRQFICQRLYSQRLKQAGLLGSAEDVSYFGFDPWLSTGS